MSVVAKKESMRKFAIVILTVAVLLVLACGTGNKTQSFHVDKPAAGECLWKYSISVIYSGGITQDTVLYLPCECMIEQESSNGSAYLYLVKFGGEKGENKRRLLYETNAQIMLSRRDTLFAGQKIFRDDRKLFFRDVWW